MDMKRDYYEDIQLFKSGVILFWFFVLGAGLLAFPFVVKNYWVYVANYIAINIIVALGLNLLVGFTGQISLGHAGFFAIGAYGTIILMIKAGFPFLLALLMAAFGAAPLWFFNRPAVPSAQRALSDHRYTGLRTDHYPHYRPVGYLRWP